MTLDARQSIWGQLRQICERDDAELSAYTQVLLMLGNEDESGLRSASEALCRLLERRDAGLVVHFRSAIAKQIDAIPAKTSLNISKGEGKDGPR